jgi:hypothetical protein
MMLWCGGVAADSIAALLGRVMLSFVLFKQAQLLFLFLTSMRCCSGVLVLLQARPQCCA